MSRQISYNYTDSGVSGVASLEKDIAILNYGSDYRVKSDDPGECVITNITSPIDRPETFRFGTRIIADVYRNQGVDSAYYAPSRKGIAIVVNLSDILKYSDSADSTFKDQYIPISGHIVLNVPAHEAVTASIVSSFVGRLVAGLYGSGSLTDDRLKSIMRESLVPTDM